MSKSFFAHFVKKILFIHNLILILSIVILDFHLKIDFIPCFPKLLILSILVLLLSKADHFQK